MEVKAHHTRLSVELVLRPCGVLEGEAADETGRLAMEIIGTIAYSEEILVPGVPNNRRYVLLPRLLSGESPKRKDRAVVLGNRILHLILVVLVIIKLLLISVLHDHSLHDLEGSLHGGGVESVFFWRRLGDLGLFLLLDLLFPLSFQVCFVLAHVGVEDLPLGGFSGEPVKGWRVSFYTSFFKRQIKSLNGALLEIELVPERLLLNLFISLD